jgi:hypothetical protein
MTVREYPGGEDGVFNCMPVTAAMLFNPGSGIMTAYVAV